MLGNAPKSKITGIPGWLTHDEEMELYQRADEFENGVFLEIGGEFGRSAGAMAATKRGKVYSVDIRFDGELGEIHAKNIEEAGLSEYVIRVAADSKELHSKPKFRSRKFDVVFIDGDHSEEGAYLDLVNWCPKVRGGGYLLVHDCAVATNLTPHYTHYDVLRAVDNWRAEQLDFELIKTVDSMMVFRRYA